MNNEIMNGMELILLYRTTGTIWNIVELFFVFNPIRVFRESVTKLKCDKVMGNTNHDYIDVLIE